MFFACALVPSQEVCFFALSIVLQASLSHCPRPDLSRVLGQEQISLKSSHDLPYTLRMHETDICSSREEKKNKNKNKNKNKSKKNSFLVLLLCLALLLGLLLLLINPVVQSVSIPNQQTLSDPKGRSARYVPFKTQAATTNLAIS